MRKLKCNFQNGVSGWILAILLFSVSTIQSQEVCERILIQDSTLNNLIDPENYKTTAYGEIGNIEKVGTGKQNLIFIPGLGFGGSVFKTYAEQHREEFTSYLITLPGFGNTNALPAPPESVSFGDQSWTNSSLNAVQKYINERKITDPIIIGHWLTGTQIALKLALNDPKNVKAAIIIAGSACFVGQDTTKFPVHPPIDFRIKVIDNYMAPKWFKTVTRETWDDNNFLPNDYATNPIRGLRLWREAAQPALHVWVRYLCEFSAQDISLELEKLEVPTLLLKPDFEGNFFEAGNNYMQNFCHTSWEPEVNKNDKIQVITVPNSRVFIWFDNPEVFEKEIENFVAKL